MFVFGNGVFEDSDTNESYGLMLLILMAKILECVLIN